MSEPAGLVEALGSLTAVQHRPELGGDLEPEEVRVVTGLQVCGRLAKPGHTARKGGLSFFRKQRLSSLKHRLFLAALLQRFSCAAAVLRVLAGAAIYPPSLFPLSSLIPPLFLLYVLACAAYVPLSLHPIHSVPSQGKAGFFLVLKQCLSFRPDGKALGSFLVPPPAPEMQWNAKERQ